ncbi:DUF1684 domain-containing protein [Pseudonocardia alaniniphila]|uniref:DUF1684 domain-containing protein n=1 Tax=Pseudonocardia alaniniphila TaxID=75291 RepID=A0ABS9TQQ1_9PSEU|nr:DUF1684 domain-containing protein [Pseudonocardia alaniniphila]MCH6170865.1 DUF1684 domain-containing protein [Pseudonocardia alaniniphila]
MSITDSRSSNQHLRDEWASWHAEREADLWTSHGWLSLTGLYWLDVEPRSFEGLPGTWRATGDGGVEVSAAEADGLVVGGMPVTSTVRLEPVDGVPGVLVEAGPRTVEVVRRTDSYALRVRDPEAITRTEFTGVPTFPVDARWVVDGRFAAYPQPRRITVGAVVDGLQHFPTAVGVVHFSVHDGDHELVALRGKAGGLVLHFRDATSGESTYGGGRVLTTLEPDAEGRVRIDFNRTVNLPCAFTAYATCPLPPAENLLTVAVEAGERDPARPDVR